MDLFFAKASLAVLCNSESLLVERWGADGFRLVARRLLELAATADLDDVAALPGATTLRGPRGSVTIDFGRGAVVITGTVANDPTRDRRRDASEVRLLITGLTVHERSPAT